eukprot:m.45982 g.45982  ORF g.45982 m.45982 type:complete len:133 (-) comp10704_c0_seq3:951-1349(-)
MKAFLPASVWTIATTTGSTVAKETTTYAKAVKHLQRVLSRNAFDISKSASHQFSQKEVTKENLMYVMHTRTVTHALTHTHTQTHRHAQTDTHRHTHTYLSTFFSFPFILELKFGYKLLSGGLSFSDSYYCVV